MLENPSILFPHSLAFLQLLFCPEFGIQSRNRHDKHYFSFPWRPEPCNRTKTPCLKCPNSLTHFSPFVQKQSEFVWVLQSPERNQSSRDLCGHFEEEQINDDDLENSGGAFRPVGSQTWFVLPLGLPDHTKYVLFSVPKLLEDRFNGQCSNSFCNPDLGNCPLNPFLCYLLLPSQPPLDLSVPWTHWVHMCPWIFACFVPSTWVELFIQNFKFQSLHQNSNVPLSIIPSWIAKWWLPGLYS